MKPVSRRVLPGNAQHVGDREYQEDAFGFTSQEDAQFVRHAGVAAVLCDGMGGLQFGAEAAAIGVDTFLDEYRRKLPDELPSEALKRCAQRANEAVYRFAERNGVVKQTGCTLVAVVVRGAELHCVHVGDSRAYLFSGDRLDRLTEDHSYGRTLQRQVDAGNISETEAQTHPLKDHLVSNLGRPTLEGLDVMHPPRRLMPHDCVMLCSDGLHGVLSDEEIAAEIRGSSQEAAQRLVDRVLTSGQPDKDNVTVVMLQVQPDGSVKHDHRLSRTSAPEPVLPASPTGRRSAADEKPVRSAAGTRTLGNGAKLALLAVVPLLVAAAVWALWPAAPVAPPVAPTVSGITPAAPATVPAQVPAQSPVQVTSPALPDVKSTAPSTFSGSMDPAATASPKRTTASPVSNHKAPAQGPLPQGKTHGAAPNTGKDEISLRSQGSGGASPAEGGRSGPTPVSAGSIASPPAMNAATGTAAPSPAHAQPPDAGQHDTAKPAAGGETTSTPGPTADPKPITTPTDPGRRAEPVPMPGKSAGPAKPPVETPRQVEP